MIMASDHPQAQSTTDENQTAAHEIAFPAHLDASQELVSADVVHIEHSGVAAVEANTVTVSQGGVQTVNAEHIQIEQGGIGQATAGEINVSLGGVGMAQADRISLNETHAGVIAAHTVEATNVQAGLLVARQVNGDVQAAITERTAAVFGLVVGLSLGALLLLFRRR